MFAFPQGKNKPFPGTEACATSNEALDIKNKLICHSSSLLNLHFAFEKQIDVHFAARRQTLFDAVNGEL